MDRTDRNSKEITVLGAGIIGIFCALNLLENGYSVTLIDRDEPGEGASFGNAGVISPWSCVPQCLPGTLSKLPHWLIERDGPVSFRWRDLPTTLPWTLKFLANSTLPKVEAIADSMDAIMAGNIDVYRRFLKQAGRNELLLDSWYVNVFRGEAKADLNDLPWKLRMDRGADIALATGDEIREIEPEISAEYHSAVIIKGQSRAFSPGQICKALARLATDRGAVFRKAEIRKIERGENGGFRLVIPEDSISAQRLVLACGFWSRDLLKSLGISIPVMSERGYHLEFTDPGISLSHSILDVNGKFVASSMQNGIRAAGTAEFARHDAPPNYRRAHILEPQTRRLFPNLNPQSPTRPWMGVRPSTPDSLPVIGTFANLPGLFAAFGHGHYGMGMAPVTGRIIAGLLQGAGDNRDWQSVSPERFVK